MVRGACLDDPLAVSIVSFIYPGVVHLVLYYFFLFNGYMHLSTMVWKKIVGLLCCTEKLSFCETMHLKFVEMKSCKQEIAYSKIAKLANLIGATSVQIYATFGQSWV